MAKAKATADVLVGFSNDLKGKHDDILNVKKSMDEQLGSFLWDDPVGRAFISDYQEKVKPIEGKLVPNLASYSQYLDQEAAIIRQYGGQ